jgi:outer membrane receptor for ferrienterochelin and colicin
MKSKSRLLWLVLLSSCRPGWSQEVTGNLEGRILQVEGKPLAQVNITIHGPSLQGQRGTASDHDGYFRLLRLPVGAYTVKLSHVAHQEVSYENIPIRLGKTTTLGEVRLQSRMVEMAEVVVSGERPVIDPTTTTIGENLQPETFNNLPVERNFRTIPTLVPQANTSFYGDEANISGSTGSENTYVIDGMNVTDIGLAAGSINLPYNFIKEIEVKTGGYEAEYGRALGGIINVITHSGSNHLHGQLFGFFTNQELGGEGRLNVEGAKVAGFSQYDVGLSLNGPILRDKLWFFAAYNPNVAYEDIALPSLGTYRDKITYHLFAGKLTWQAAANTSIVFTVLGDPSTHHIVNTNFGSNEIANADLLLIAEEEGSIGMSLTARQTMSQNLLLEAAISRLHDYDQRQGETERGRNEPIFRDFVNGIFSGGVGFALRVDDFRTAAKMSASLALGKHT